MPVVIDEIVVTVEVTGTGGQETTAGASMNEQEKQELIALCVEKVMEILNQKNER